MKKRLSLLMVLMMVLSLVPMSAFATAGSMPGGLIKVDDTDKDTFKKVTVKLTQAAGTELTTGGKAKITLSKGEFAQKNTAGTEINGVVIGNAAGQVTAADANTYVTRTAAFNYGQEAGVPVLDGAITMDQAFANVAYVEIPAMGNTIKKEIDILVTFYAYFDEEDAGDITFSVEEQNDSGLDVSKPIVIGTVNVAEGEDMKLSVADATKKIGFDGGSLSKFTVKDIDKNATANSVDLELPDYVEWNMAETAISLGGAKVSVVGNAAGQYQFIDSKGDVVATKTNIVRVYTGATKSELNVDPYVSVIRRDAAKGDVTLKVIARDAAKSKLETLDKVIGVIADYDVVMTAVEKGKKEIPALYGGDDATIKVKLSGVVGSFTNNRQVDFTVKGADVKVDSIKGFSNVKTESVKADEDDATIVKDGEFTLAVDGTEKKTLEFEMKIKTEYAQNGAVVLTADSRDFGKIECEVAKVTPAYTVEFDKVTPIKKGESVATADITIKEAKAGLFDSDEFIVVALSSKNIAGTEFATDYKVETTNGLKVEDKYTKSSSSKKTDDRAIVFDVKTSSSKEAATIKLTNVMVMASGSAVDGDKMIETYMVNPKDAGKASTFDEAMNLTVWDSKQDPDYSKAYVKVVKEYGTVATTTVFKIGSKEYTVNGESKTANEAPYVSGKGYTMLPVRAIGEALGLKADWNASTKTATFSNDSKVASVVIGADVMYVNGTPFKLSAKAEIKNGSTFVELRSLASAFGVKLEWDAATKSVTIQG